MAEIDVEYRKLVEEVLARGERRQDRTGVGTISLFGYQYRIDLREGLPLLTTKKVRFDSVVKELLWFLRGETNIRTLGCGIWDAWANEDGECGPIYGFSFRRFGDKPDAVKQRTPKLRVGVLPTYLGVANGGGGDNCALKKTWEGLIARCYDKKSPSYKRYGARGVSVCDRWLEYAAFAEDAKLIPGWTASREVDGRRLVLDKDIRGSGFLYSLDSCVWVTDQENANAGAEFVTEVERDGVVYAFSNARAFCAKHGVESRNFSDLWTGAKGAKRRGGFRLVSRTPIHTGVDQIANLIDGLRNSPSSRRHVVSAWNPVWAEGVSLPPCHTLFQCYVSLENHLDLQLYQRSADVALGLPFNVASYALLMELLAAETGLTPRYFIHSLGDVHVYQPHVEALKEQVQREPFPAPKLDILNDHSSIRTASSSSDFAPGDFRLNNYQYHPHIKYEVAV